MAYDIIKLTHEENTLRKYSYSSGWSMRQTAHFCLVPRLQMSGAVPPIWLHSLMTCTVSTFLFIITNKFLYI
jgi:hypothetical protein